MPKNIQIIDHTADIGIRAFGKDLPEALCYAARGMFSLITDLRRVRCLQTIEIEVTAADRYELLVEWLNELLFRFDTEQMLFRQFTISALSDTRLKAEVRGEKVDKKRHDLKKGIKAATYHGLKIESTASGCRIEVILDI
jgi:SHS2 domain-containing protein